MRARKAVDGCSVNLLKASEFNFINKMRLLKLRLDFSIHKATAARINAAW